MNEIVRQVTMETLSFSAYCTRMNNLMAEALQHAQDDPYENAELYSL